MSNFSIKDRLAKAGSPLKRKLVDKVVKIEGSPVDVLKLTSTKVGMSGDTQQLYDSCILTDVIMRFPVNEMEIIENLNDEGHNSVNAIDLWDLLPSKMVVYFNGDCKDKVSEIKVDDIIVHVLYDENNNKIPILFQVSRPMGRFMAGKYLIKREWELCKYRGIPEYDIQERVDIYLESLDDSI